MESDESTAQSVQTVHLLRRYRNGDDRALDALFGRYYERLRAVVRLRMGAKLRACCESVDIVQEAFLASFRALDDFTYRSEGDFFHWLCKITENRIRDQADYYAARKRDVSRKRPLELDRPSYDSFVGPIRELASFSTPSHRAIVAEDLIRLEAAIDDLPEAQREALLLVRYEGLSFSEAGERLKRSPDAVRMLVARAIVALSKRLDPGTDTVRDGSA